MGLFNGIIKAGVAKRVLDEGRKPANQAKAKQLFQQLQAKRGGGASRPPR